MFWLLLLCHFLADYPLQTDGMVCAKKRFIGLLMHVFVHFVTMITVLRSIAELEIKSSLILALSVSILHFGIDHWKNVLSQLRPTWVIFSYIQDQILHLLSLVLVCFIYSQYAQTEVLAINFLMIFYTIGLIIATHFWFVTERVFATKSPVKLQWVNHSMWPRMISRGLLYGVLYTTDLFSGLALCTASVVVVWNDLQAEKRMDILLFDLVGTMILMSFIGYFGAQFF